MLGGNADDFPVCHHHRSGAGRFGDLVFHPDSEFTVITSALLRLPITMPWAHPQGMRYFWC